MMTQSASPSLAATFAAPSGLGRLGRNALLIGVAASVVSLVGGFLNADQFFQSYLVGFLFWLAITLGCLAILMLHHVTGSIWGLVVRRVLEAGSLTLPLMALLFLPVLLGLDRLFLWAQPDIVASDELLRHKAPYLNPAAFTARAVFYFVVLGVLTALLNRWSSEQDQSGHPRLKRRMKVLSAPGIALYCLTVTFLSVDWLMSLDPHWFSSIYGIYMIGGQGLATLAFIILAASQLAARPPMSGVIRVKHLGDYGNLMLAFLMLWAYFSISQLIIIWSGNLPEEIPWYLKRLTGDWQRVALALVIVHFALPFLLLLSRTVKTSRRFLTWVAGLVLVMRWLDLYWQAGPVFHPGGIALHWLDLAAPVAMGGLWVAVFAWQLGRRALLPVGDPGVEEALRHG
jgi:hypothetical protein